MPPAAPEPRNAATIASTEVTSTTSWRTVSAAVPPVRAALPAPMPLPVPAVLVIAYLPKLVVRRASSTSGVVASLGTRMPRRPPPFG